MNPLLIPNFQLDFYTDYLNIEFPDREPPAQCNQISRGLSATPTPLIHGLISI